MMSNSSIQNWFRNKAGALATMHHKEQVIAPILEHNLGVHIIVPQDFNTDEFGTFTRDIKRPGDQISTARLKVEKAMTLTGLTLAIASEGSFGPHPSIPFLPCNREIVLLSDREHNLEIIGQAISTETNYCHQPVTSLEEVLTFAQKIGFPTHGLVVMSDAQPTQATHISKGITDETQLKEIAIAFLKQFGQIHLEPDLRAMYNPTRMNVIAQATHDLIHKISQCCPHCNFPGFVPVERKAGLPCELCGLPTNLTLALIRRCNQCNFSNAVYYPDGNELADAAQCSYCNP